MKRLLGLLLAVPAAAANLETAPVKPLAPLELGLGAPLAPLGALPFGTPGLAPLVPAGAGALSPAQFQLPTALAPIDLPAAAELARPASAAQAELPRATLAGVEHLAEGIAKDQAPGGALTATLSGQTFDGFMALPETQAIPSGEVTADQVKREIEEPPRVLRERGIQGIIPVYGSARIPSPEEAQAKYKSVLETHGRKPKSPEGRAALKEARQAIRNSKFYALARRFGELVARGGGGKIAIVTGGGPGIMEAASRGAFEAGGPSVGFNIKLPHEQKPNPYLTPGLSFDFEHFPSRKMNLRNGAVAMVFFPGGYGTMDELFEVMTLMQTGKIPRRPLVLVGEKDYWKKVLHFRAFAQMGLISKTDLDIFRFAETAEEAWAIVRGQAPAARAGSARPKS